MRSERQRDVQFSRFASAKQKCLNRGQLMERVKTQSLLHVETLSTGNPEGSFSKEDQELQYMKKMWSARCIASSLI